jgi:hypothetical protein
MKEGEGSSVLNPTSEASKPFTEAEAKEAFKTENGRDPTQAELENTLNEANKMMKETSNAAGQLPSEEEIKQAFKEEMGRDPTPKELEDFKA